MQIYQVRAPNSCWMRASQHFKTWRINTICRRRRSDRWRRWIWSPQPPQISVTVPCPKNLSIPRSSSKRDPATSTSSCQCPQLCLPHIHRILSPAASWSRTSTATTARRVGVMGNQKLNQAKKSSSSCTSSTMWTRALGWFKIFRINWLHLIRFYLRLFRKWISPSSHRWPMAWAACQLAWWTMGNSRLAKC